MKNPRLSGSGAKGGQNAFNDLSTIVRKAGLKLEPTHEEVSEPESVVESETPRSDETDESVFLRAVDGVNRLSWRHATSPSPSPSPPEIRNGDSEERRLMEAAVKGDPELAVPDHPEYIEGWIGISGRRYLPSLRGGLYSIQEQIDLHGLSRGEAHRAVEEFILGASRFRSCCVKIIHGRGINSPSDRAVLKESLQQWLSTRRMSRHVVAYASAPLKDGGVGALYVLLRSRSHS